MHFLDFKNTIENLKTMDLPGEQYHFKMAPLERLKELKERAKTINNTKTAAVLCMFYPSNNYETYFTLILRKADGGVHASQVGFPGGKEEDTDVTLMHTAFRETEEEIGVLQQEINLIKPLTEVYIPPSNFFVYPFMGYTSTLPNFKLQVEEVAALIQVPLKELLSDKVKIIQTLSTSYAKNLEVPAFNLQGHTVWGATAMMLNEVRTMFLRL